MAENVGPDNPFEPPQTDRVESDAAEISSEPTGSASDEGDAIQSVMRRTYRWMFFMALVLALFGVFSLVQTWTGQQYVSYVDASSGYVPDSYRMLVRSKLVFAVLYFLSAALLTRAAMSARRASMFGTSDQFEEAIDRQRQFWTYAGVMTIGALIIVIGVGLYTYLETTDLP